MTSRLESLISSRVALMHRLPPAAPTPPPPWWPPRARATDARKAAERIITLTSKYCGALFMLSLLSVRFGLTIFYANFDPQTNFRRRVVCRRMHRNYKFEKEPQQVKVLKGRDLVTATLAEKSHMRLHVYKILLWLQPKRQWRNISTILLISKAIPCRLSRCSRAQSREHRPDPHKEHINAASRDEFHHIAVVS